MMDDMSGWSWVWMSAMMVLFWGALLLSGDQFEQIRQDLNKTA